MPREMSHILSISHGQFLGLFCLILRSVPVSDAVPRGAGTFSHTLPSPMINTST